MKLVLPGGTGQIGRVLVRDGWSGVFNLAAPEPLTNRKFVVAVHRAFGRAWSVPIPRWALELGAFVRRSELVTRRCAAGGGR